MLAGSIEKADVETGCSIKVLVFDLLSSWDDRSLPGEPILSLEKTMAGWYWARSERRAISPNLLVLTGLLPANSKEDFLRPDGLGSGEAGSKKTQRHSTISSRANVGSSSINRAAIDARPTANDLTLTS